MRLHGLGQLGMDDTTVLQPGTVVSFEVYGGSCSGVYESDIQNGLNNWLSQMMTVNAVTTNALGYVPTIVDVSVTATVTQAIPAGELRGQIIAALNALSQGVSTLNCGGVSLKDNVINAAGGGTNIPVPTSGVPWSTTTVIAAVALLGAVVLLKE